MTTIRQIITDGLREAGLLAVGDDAEADVFEESLRRFNVLLRGFFGNELGEQLTNVNFGNAGLSNVYAIFEDMSSDIQSTYVSSNVRLLMNIDAAYTLYLNPNPEDGARLGIIDNGGNLASHNVILNGNGRRVELSNSVTLNTNLLNREWFYRADLGSWSRIADLAAEDESPLPVEFDDLLTTALALRVNARFGAPTSDDLMTILNRMRKMFRARYRQTVSKPVEDGLLILPSSYWWRNKGITF